MIIDLPQAVDAAGNNHAQRMLRDADNLRGFFGRFAPGLPATDYGPEIWDLLTNAGPNAGIVCGPMHPKRHDRMKTRRRVDPHLAPEDWMEAAERVQGAWWPAWQGWLAAHSGARVKPPAVGAAKKGFAVLADAPGRYVRQR